MIEKKRYTTPKNFENYYHSVLGVAHGHVGDMEFVITSDNFNDEEKLKTIQGLIDNYREVRKSFVFPYPESK